MTQSEFLQYFNPVSLKEIGFELNKGFEKWGDKLIINLADTPLPQIDNTISMAFIGITEDRASVSNKGCSHTPDEVRRYFYPLMPQKTDIKILDLGNLRLGSDVQNTYFALGEVMAFLLERRITPVIIGGSNDLAIGAYRAYVNLSQIINIFALDAKFDLVGDDEPVSDENFLHEIICSEPNYLFDYTHAGYQTYFVDSKALDLLDDLRFERLRLGQIQNNIERAEPLVRDADMVVVDMNCVRASDAPSSPSPHGFYGEELCKIVNYAGMSDKLTSIGFFGNNVLFDLGGRTSHIIAHAIYYFIDGYLWRKNDYPYNDDDNYIRFNVMLNDFEDEIVFYKSKKSDRWWVQVPCTNEMKRKYMRHYMVPCLYSDYQSAGQGQVPARWLVAYNKLNI
ncbi:MAG: formimidoylglutamase [Bacteroidales bacterium]|nr:formimidoylglutamase [Bacteroidales bacterium]